MRTFATKAKGSRMNAVENEDGTPPSQQHLIAATSRKTLFIGKPPFFRSEIVICPSESLAARFK